MSDVAFRTAPTKWWAFLFFYTLNAFWLQTMVGQKRLEYNPSHYDVTEKVWLSRPQLNLFRKDYQQLIPALLLANAINIPSAFSTSQTPFASHLPSRATMGHHRTLRDHTLTSVARLQLKDMASGLAGTVEDNNTEWASSWMGPESSQSSAAHQFPAELLQSASLPSQATKHHADPVICTNVNVRRWSCGRILRTARVHH